jgi:hypothetical protein
MEGKRNAIELEALALTFTRHTQKPARTMSTFRIIVTLFRIISYLTHDSKHIFFFESKETDREEIIFVAMI